MAIKIKLPTASSRRDAPRKASGGHRQSSGQRQSSSARHHLSLTDPIVKMFVSGFLIAGIIFMAVFAYFYVKYERIVDRRMSGQIFSNAAKIYARPRTVAVGDRLSAQEIASELRRAGYEEGHESPIGHFRLVAGGIDIEPGPQSFHSSENARIRFSGAKISEISSGGSSANAYELEPQLVTALFEGQDRAKREIIKFNDLPKDLVDAIVAIEDRRFFQHSGVNYYRLIEAATTDIMRGHRGQGGSTITMQLARGFFLTPEKTMKRKLTEMIIAVDLEQKFSKQRIFEMYANQVPLGQRGSFSIMGVGEASRAYFNKDVKSLTLPEAALIAGLIQRPSYLSPYRHPERALERRNLVLDSMVETGAITRQQADHAKASPLKLAPPNVEASDAPYFVDLVKDQLTSQYSETELNEQALRVYSTVNPDLQLAAAEAVDEGMKLVDDQILKHRTKKIKVGTGKTAKTEVKVETGPMPQVALIALDPHTGEVLALVGGRNYGLSQLNHALAKRPTGSIFKPFVYAAAVNTALNGTHLETVAQNADGTTTTNNAIFTPATLLDDSPVSITYGDQVYEPRNYHDTYNGEVTARYALALSLNNATVRLAQEVGFDKVAALAKAAGITSVHATPSIALGSYDATPLEMAGAYTVFSNGGTRLAPRMLRSVRDANGKVLDDYDTDSKSVLDPRVAYVLTSMMESVINNGTGYPVRARGFAAPAAGKTGTSHDAWFAGYTTNLLCIVWVGNDDYTDIKLAGGAAAAPIWAEFMKRAVKLPEYSNSKPFSPPQGVVVEQIDKVTNKLATPSCPQTYTVAFIAGTEPKETCDQAFTDHRNVFSKILGIGSPPPAPPPGTTNGTVQPVSGPQGSMTEAQPPQPAPPKKKKGLFSRIFGGKDNGGDESQAKEGNPQSPAPAPQDNGNNSAPK